MTRSSVVLCLLACGAALHGPPAARAQRSPRPDDARACAMQSGQAAIDGCTRAIASRRFNRSDLALLHYRRAMLLREAKDFDGAIADFSAAIHLNGDAIPMSADAFDLRIAQRSAYAFRARTFEDKGDYERALADYDALMKADPKDVQSLLARARTLARKGACDRAVADYDAIVAINPAAWDAYLGRARCYATLGDRDRAIADYRALLAGAPPDAIGTQALSELKQLGATP